MVLLIAFKSIGENSMIKRKPKFSIGRVIATKDGRYFQVKEITPCWDSDAPVNDQHPDRFTYRELWTEHHRFTYRERGTEHREENLRPLTARECGRK